MRCLLSTPPKEDTIFIKPKKPKELPVPVFFNETPPIDIIGNVMNAGEYLPGVNIIIKRTGKGTTTDVKKEILR